MNELEQIAALQQRIAVLEDMRAYQELYTLLFERLHRFAFSLLKCREAAEEVVSDVFIKIWQMRHDLQKIGALKVYLYTATRNCSLNYIARQSRHQTVPLEGVDEATAQHQPTPEEQMISAELRRKIQAAISELPPQCRTIFQLVREDGLKYKEVAEIMQVSVLTVRNQVAIATRKLAAALSPSLRSGFASVHHFSQS